MGTSSKVQSRKAPKHVPHRAPTPKPSKEAVVNEPDPPSAFADDENPYRSYPRLSSPDPPKHSKHLHIVSQPLFPVWRTQIVRQLDELWSQSSPKLKDVRSRLYEEWYGSENRERFEKFLSLLVRSESLSRTSLQDRLDRIDRVENELEKFGWPAEEYFEWVRKIHGWIFEVVEEPEKFGGAIRPAEFMVDIDHADWRVANDESAVINAMLLYGSDEEHHQRPDLRLRGDFESFCLGLRLHGRVLAIRDTDASTLDLYEIRALNLKIILSLRFDPTETASGGDGVEKTVEKRSLLVVPLGNILFDKPQEKTWQTKSIDDNDGSSRSPERVPRSFKGDWQDTGFALVLEIQKNGRPGDLYVVCNLTYVDIYGQPQLLDIKNRDSDDPLFKFCGKSTPFTVAKVGLRKNTPLGSFLMTAEALLLRPSAGQIQLTAISRSAPEIVETAMCGSTLWSEGGDPPVGLYPT